MADSAWQELQDNPDGPVVLSKSAYCVRISLSLAYGVWNLTLACNSSLSHAYVVWLNGKEKAKQYDAEKARILQGCQCVVCFICAFISYVGPSIIRSHRCTRYTDHFHDNNLGVEAFTEIAREIKHFRCSMRVCFWTSAWVACLYDFLASDDIKNSIKTMIVFYIYGQAYKNLLVIVHILCILTRWDIDLFIVKRLKHRYQTSDQVARNHDLSPRMAILYRAIQVPEHGWSVALLEWKHMRSRTEALWSLKFGGLLYGLPVALMSMTVVFVYIAFIENLKAVAPVLVMFLVGGIAMLFPVASANTKFVNTSCSKARNVSAIPAVVYDMAPVTSSQENTEYLIFLQHMQNTPCGIRFVGKIISTSVILEYLYKMILYLPVVTAVIQHVLRAGQNSQTHGRT